MSDSRNYAVRVEYTVEGWFAFDAPSLVGAQRCAIVHVTESIPNVVPGTARVVGAIDRAELAYHALSASHAAQAGGWVKAARTVERHGEDLDESRAEMCRVAAIDALMRWVDS